MRRKTELLTALCETGRRLDTARNPAEMKRLIRERKRISAALEAMAPPPLRIFRGTHDEQARPG